MDKRFKPKLRLRLYKLWWEYRPARLVCRYFGHKYPLEQKMWCRVCPRCSLVVEMYGKDY